MAVQYAKSYKTHPAEKRMEPHAGLGTRLCAGHTLDAPRQVLFRAPETQRKRSSTHSGPHLGVTSQPMLLEQHISQSAKIL